MKKLLRYEDLENLKYKPIKLYQGDTDKYLIMCIGTDGHGYWQAYLASNQYDFRLNIAYNGEMNETFYYEEVEPYLHALETMTYLLYGAMMKQIDDDTSLIDVFNDCHDAVEKLLKKYKPKE